MKTVQSSNALNPKLSAKILINRASSGRFMRVQSKSTSEQNLLDSQSLIKRPGEVQNQRQNLHKKQSQYHYDFFNLKRPRIKNVNGFFKIKRNEKIYHTHAYNRNQRNSSRRRSAEKSSKIKLNPSTHKVSTYETRDIYQSKSPIKKDSYPSQLVQLRDKLKQDYQKMLKKIIKVDSKINDEQAKEQIWKGTLNLIKRFSNTEDYSRMNNTSHTGFYLNKQSLQETSDNQSSKEIVDEYGLRNSLY